jgi:hypothetical protein
VRNPLRVRRIGLALIALAALLAATATWQRDHLAPGSSARSATYLLDVLGWFLAIAGAVLEAKIGDLLLNAGQRAARRRAIVFAVIGLGASLTACITIPGRSDAAFSVPLRAGLAAVLVGGIGIGLGGAATLIWFYGGRYAADRIAKMGEEDW